MRYEGAIYRPPGERNSDLLQATVGCSHNACSFCAMYKDKRYHVRPMADILVDIRMAGACYGDVSRVFLCDGDAIDRALAGRLRLRPDQPGGYRKKPAACGEYGMFRGAFCMPVRADPPG